MYKIYQHEKDGKTITRVFTSANGQFDPEGLENPDAQAYLAWVAEGNIAEEWTPNGNQ